MVLLYRVVRKMNRTETTQREYTVYKLVCRIVLTNILFEIYYLWVIDSVKKQELDLRWSLFLKHMQHFKNAFQIRYNYYYKMRYFMNRIMVFDRHTHPLLHLMNDIAKSNDKTSLILDKTTKRAT